MARRKPHKPPSQEEIARLAEGLGRIMIAAAQLEHALGIVIGSLFKLTNVRYWALVIPMSASSKITMLRQLGKQYLSPQENKELRAVLREVQKCTDLRNELAHGFYGAKHGRPYVLTHSGDGRFTGLPVSWKDEHFSSFLERIDRVKQSVRHTENLFPRPLPRLKGQKPTPAFPRG